MFLDVTGGLRISNTGGPAVLPKAVGLLQGCRAWLSPDLAARGGTETLTHRHVYSLGTLCMLSSRMSGTWPLLPQRDPAPKSGSTKDLLLLCPRAGMMSSSLRQFTRARICWPDTAEDKLTLQ